jgi:hypothetical protein
MNHLERDMSKLSLLPGCRIDELRRAGPGALIVVAQSRRDDARCPEVL